MLDPVIMWVVSLCMSLLFLTAGWHKLASGARFKTIVAEYEILPRFMSDWVATVIPIAELGLAVLWLIQPAAVEVVIASILLLATYCSAIAVNLKRGRVHISCGCSFSGSSDEEQPLSGALIVRNSILILVLLVCLLPPSERDLLWVDYFALVLATITAILLYGSASQLLKNSTIVSWRNS